VPAAGTSAYEGTLSADINPQGEITGTYVDSNFVFHGFLRSPHGVIVTFDAPDTHKIMRKSILFELAPLEAFSSTAEEDLSETTVQDLMKDSLDELHRKALADSADHRTPVERRALVRMRSRAVRLYVLQRANGKCEGCGAAAPFTTVNGSPYLEPHHIRRLTDGGPDDPRWVAGICPNCHRRAHYSRDAAEYNTKLAEVVQELEKHSH
jgi:5-methylcytosine-specific restriction enzyme A